MKRTTQIHVDETTYSVTQYMATRGQQLLVKLLKLALTGPAGAVHLVDIEWESAIENALSNLDPETSSLLINEILSGTQIHEGGKIREINFDLDFAGRYLHLIKLLKEILRFQYNDFLAETASLA